MKGENLINYTKSDILRRHWNRSRRARLIDRARKAEETGPFEDLALRNKWYRHPNRYDIIGVDSMGAALFRQDPQFHLLKESAVLKKPRGSRRGREISPQMKKRIAYVQKTTGERNTEAENLIRREESAGVSYDVVPWDRLQGRDLTYGTRLKTMESIIGTTTKKKVSTSKKRLREMESAIMGGSRAALRDYMEAVL